MSNKQVFLCLAHMGGQEQKFIQEAFDTNWVVPLGPNVDGFERDLEAYLGGGVHVAALASGTSAVHVALVLLGVGQGDEVICQSFTFAASANPIVYQGASPVFVDSEADTWNMSPALLASAIEERISSTGRKPKAIIVAHLYGMPAKMNEIMDIARRYGIPVVEDAAEALGSRYGGQPCGTLGDLGVLSFNGNKMITTSGGGALICRTEEEKRKAVFYATQAREPFPYYQHEHIGYNYRLSNICAGIGRGQMFVLDEHIAHHRHVSALYAEKLDGVKGITVHRAPQPLHDSNYWLSTILVDSSQAGTDYTQIQSRLAAEGVESRPLWKPLHMQPVFSSAPRYVDGTSERLFSLGLCLPSGPWVSDDDVERIVKIIRQCVRN